MITNVIFGIVCIVICTLWVVERRKSIQEYKDVIDKMERPSDSYQVGALGEQVAHAVEIMSGLSNTIEGVGSDLPGKVLQSIQGSINPRKGKVGELVTMLQLTSEYHRIIHLGQPVDMIGVSEDSIDFIEVKVGTSQLSTMERKIKELVDGGKVRFVVVRPNIEIGGPGNDEVAG